MANIYGKTGAIAIERSSDAPAQVIVTNTLGQTVASTSTNSSIIELPVNISNAIYIVTVREAGKETVKKVFVN
jgi:hypothetical protein